MALPPYWFRLTLDLDPSGDCVGTSYEVHSADRIVAIHVLPAPAPHANAHDELEVLADNVKSWYGIVVPLF